MTQEILDKYFIISNNYFTMKGCTEKEDFLDFFCTYPNLKNDKNFSLLRPPLQFFHNNPSNMRKKIKFLILSQNFGSFTPFTKGMNIFGSKMSM